MQNVKKQKDQGTLKSSVGFIAKPMFFDIQTLRLRTKVNSYVPQIYEEINIFEVWLDCFLWTRNMNWEMT